jgi:hypothetical protein
MGVLLLRNGKPTQGVFWLKRALANDHTHRPAHRALAGYYAGIGKKKLAAYQGHLAKD